MTKQVSLFGGTNPLANSDLFKSLQGMNDLLTDGGSTYRRISIKGGKFREILNGEQIKVSKSDTMNIVVVGIAPIARTFFEGAYDPEAKPVPPTCWSADTEAPASDVETPQAARCGDCPQNIKGSGQGNSRACRFSHRFAVVVEGQLDTVYQLQLPATSLFGDAKENAMPMQGYGRLLKAHDTPVISVITEMSFDEDAEVPKLFFRPLRALDAEELETVVALMDTQEVADALHFTVSQTDGVQDHAPAKVEEVAEETVTELFPEAKKPAKKAAKPKAEPEVEEPMKVATKTASVPVDEDADDLSKLVSGWDDE